MTPHLLLTAKAPVPGEVKTRLGAEIGDRAAAALAAAALLDTIEVLTAFGGNGRCHLALSGDLGRAVDGPAISAALAGWTVRPQQGAGFAARLAHAHQQVAGPVIQVGMDTPQLTVTDLAGIAAGLEQGDAVLGPADDGGWWVLGLPDPLYAACLANVEMSLPSTCTLTQEALEQQGLVVLLGARLRDVDTIADAIVVVAEAPQTRFAEAWRSMIGSEVR